MKTRTEQAPHLRGRKSRLALNAGLILAGLSAIAATPTDDVSPNGQSEGDCVEVTVYYWALDQNGQKQYLLGPDHCALGTPWEERNRNGLEYSNDAVDSGVGFEIGVPRPTIPPSAP